MKAPVKTLTLLLVLISAFTFSSCDDDSPDATPESLSSEEAAVLIAQDLSSNVFQIAGEVDQLSTRSIEAINGRYANNSLRTELCNSTRDSSFQDSYSGDRLAYSYTISYEYGLECSPFSIPQVLNISYTADGTSTISSILRNTERGFTTTISSLGAFAVNGLGVSDDAYMVSGNVENTSQIQQLQGERINFNGNSSISNITLTLDKETKKITTGSATATLEGSNNANSYSFTATIVFNGDDTATISINGGEEYTVNLPTGELIG